MTNPDRDFLDQIDQAWDERVSTSDRTVDLNADGFGETLEALHQADLNAKPSPEFRQRLRRQLLGRSSDWSTRQQEGEYSFQADELQTSRWQKPIPEHEGGNMLERRRRWISQTGELAAMVLILATAIVGVVIWQSLGDGSGDSQQPAATGDEEVEAVPTPDENGEYLGLSFDEAQAVTPFTIVAPEYVPEGYELDGIYVIDESARAVSHGNELPEREDGVAWMYATFVFQATGNDDSQPIHLTQRNSQIMTSESPPRDAPVFSEEPTGERIEGFGSQFYVDDVAVSHEAQVIGDHTRMEFFTWNQDSLSMHLAANTDVETDGDDAGPEQRNGEPDSELMAMVESIIYQRESDEEPPMHPEMADRSEPATPPQQPTYHEVVTLEEADEIVPFDLADPREAHPDYELSMVTVNEPPTGDRFHAMMRMTSRNVDGREFLFAQQNSPVATPSASGPPRPVGQERATEEAEDPEIDQQEFDIDGLSVTRTVQYTISGDESTIYTWQQDGLGMMVSALTDTQPDQSQRDPEIAVPAEDLEQFVRSIIEARQSDDGPPVPEYSEAPDDAPVPDPPPAPQEVTLEQAREAIAFELVNLEPLPGELTLMNVSVARYEDGQSVELEDPDFSDANHVHIYLTSTQDRDLPQVVELIQTTDQIPNPEGEILEVDGHEVERLGGESGGSIEIAYVWTVGEVEYGLLANTFPQNDETSLDEFDTEPLVTDEVMIEFIRSTLP